MHQDAFHLARRGFHASLAGVLICVALLGTTGWWRERYVVPFRLVGPRGSDDRWAGMPDSIVVGVSSAGQATVNGRPVTPSQAAIRVRFLLAGRANRLVFIGASESATYGDFVELASYVRTGGATLLVIVPAQRRRGKAAAREVHTVVR